jgi:hypothetical protein
MVSTKKGTAQDEMYDQLKGELLEMRSKRRKRYHKIQTPKLLVDPWTVEGDTETFTGYLSKLLVTEASGETLLLPFGILTRHTVPTSPHTFKLWPDLAAVDITIESLNHTVPVDSGRMTLVREYTSCVLTPYLKHGLDKNADLAYFVVPVKDVEGGDSEIDWDVAHQVFMKHPFC